MRDLNIEGNGTPSVIATNAKPLHVGTSGAASFRVFTNNVKQYEIDSAGVHSSPVSLPADGTAAAALLTSGTVDATKAWNRVTTAGAVTAVVLAAGTVHGQRTILSLDKDAGGTITMAASGTSRVGTGTACVIAVGAAREFIWDNTDLIWCEMGET